MKLVQIESPYAGDVEANVEYARRAMRDCLERGEAPIASHLLYTQPGILDDEDPEQRALGMSAGFAWNAHAEACVVYADFGITPGMEKGMALALSRGIEVVLRKIGTEGDT